MAKPHTNKYKFVMVAVIAVAFLMILGGTGNYLVGSATAKTVAKVNPNGTFIFGSIQGTLTNLNPLTATSTASDIAGLLYSPMLYPGASGNLIPWLAQSYNISNNGTTFTFNLVHNATWSNGNKVTAADVNYTFQSIINTKSIDFNSLANYVKSIDVVNNYTIVFNLKQYYNPLIYDIGTQPILPAAWASYSSNLSNFTNFASNITSGSYNASNLITDGPVQLTSLSTTGGAVFVTNKQFFMGAPAYGKLVWEFFKTTSDATAALESKSIDAFWGPYTDRALFEKFSFIKSESAPSTYIFYLWLNNGIAPFNNTTVRKAVASVINKGNLNAVALAGAGVNGSYGGLPYLFRDQIASGLPYYHYNLTAASNMMNASGFVKKSGEWYYPNGTQVTATLEEPPVADWVTAGQMIEQNLTAFGIKTTFQSVSFTTWSNDVGDGTFQSTYFGYTGYAPTAWSVLNTLFNGNSSAPLGSSAWTHGWNVERYNNTTVNKLLNEAASTSNKSQEQNYLNQIQQIIAEQAPLLMTSDPPTFYSYNNHTIIDNEPNYNIAQMYSIEHIQVLEYQNQTSNNTLYYIIGGVGAVVIIAGVGAAVYSRSRKVKASRTEED